MMIGDDRAPMPKQADMSSISSSTLLPSEITHRSMITSTRKYGMAARKFQKPWKKELFVSKNKKLVSIITAKESAKTL